jgi:hypothetical protein
MASPEPGLGGLSVGLPVRRSLVAGADTLAPLVPSAEQSVLIGDALPDLAPGADRPAQAVDIAAHSLKIGDDADADGQLRLGQIRLEFEQRISRPGA